MGGLHQSSLVGRSNSWDEEARTFEFVLATETPVRAFRRDDDWNRIEVDEQLVMSGIVDIDKLRGQPILDSHYYWSLDSVIGVIDSARIEGNTLICVGRLADVDSVEEVATKVRDGIITNVSVGFEIIEEVRTVNPGGPDLVRITKWRAREASLVAVPADANANIRSLREAQMTTPENKETTPVVVPPAAPAVDPAVLAEAVRSALATAFGAPAVTTPATPAAPAKPVDEPAQRKAQIDGLRAAAERKGIVEDFDALVAAGETVENLRGVLRSAIETRSEETNGTATPRDGAQKARLLSWDETTVGKRAAGLK